VKITIKPSPTADTRSCDWSKVSERQLLDSSLQHKDDIAQALGLFQSMLTSAAVRHDFDKLTAIQHFHADFGTGFKETGWWDEHRRINRHHLMQADGIPADVNLIDVLEFIADCCMAGMARTGTVYDLNLPDVLLQRAFQNTVILLKDATVVEPGAEPGRSGFVNGFIDGDPTRYGQACPRGCEQKGEHVHIPASARSEPGREP
jgi:hypothetical protein